MKFSNFISLTALMLCMLLFSSCEKKWTTIDKNSYQVISQKRGQTLGYSSSSGIQILTKNGYAFKDLNRNGKLDIYEDWRKDIDERAQDLATQLSIEEIAGLMLYSAHQAIPSEEVTDAQKKILIEDNLRHVLITQVGSTTIAAKWNNNMQALLESVGHGIPANNSSDPRNSAAADVEYYIDAQGNISRWPSSLGMAATFDPSVVENFGHIASQEYRALGITTALSPQIDMASEPRWSRVNGTFGEDSQLSTDMARAYCDGFQTSIGDAEIAEGWGYSSVNAMIKHWPGGGSGEGGRDAHYSYGKYAVYPGNNMAEHIKSFINGALKLNGKTKSATAVMPYYTISYNQNPSGENVGNSYSGYFINDLLRGKYGFEGVVCTDWGVTKDHKAVDGFGNTCWGVEDLDETAKHYKLLMAGVDQFGGNNDMNPILEAYQLGVDEYGEEFMDARMRESAVRLLKNIFRVGLFENPYIDVDKSEELVGNPKFMMEGYEAQQKSVVMLKNKNNILPLKKDTRVYIAKKLYPETPAGRWGAGKPAYYDYPINISILEKYFTIVDNASEADVAIVYVDGPKGGSGYSREDVEKGGNGYLPITLQYKKYTANTAREISLAGGDPLEDFTNRSYKGKTITASNSSDLDYMLKVKEDMGSKPVIALINISNPMVMNEFENQVDAILLGFSVQNQALLDIVSGTVEPSGLLPIQMPADMQTVEEQFEDVSHDMRCHIDSEGNVYDFAYGLNWTGVISDTRTAKYKR